MSAESQTDKRWLLYGANGYSGALIAEAAREAGEEPILAGRREEAVRPIAERLSLPYRIFPLDDPSRLRSELESVSAVLLTAGPFSKTSRPVVEACIDTGTHYLDITGEIPVFEACHRRDVDARRAGCTVLPGVGFDVVPTDCLAASLAEALPGAERLTLAFHGVGSPSRGTMKTMIEGLAEGGAVRRGGHIVKVPAAHRVREIPFRDKPRLAMTIPWGDVSTAFYSTGIPDIEVYMALPPKAIRGAKLSRPFAPILGLGPVQRFLKKRVDRRPPGPDAEMRAQGRSHVWGRVEDPTGRAVEGTLETPEGYALTVQAALECTRRVVAGRARAGALTPSMAFGPRFVAELEGCDLRIEDGSVNAAAAAPSPSAH